MFYVDERHKKKNIIKYYLYSLKFYLKKKKVLDQNQEESCLE